MIVTDDSTSINLISGNSESLPLDLQRFNVTQAYLDGWHNFYPETKIIRPESE